MRIAECKCNSLAPCSGKEANGKIEYGKNLMKHREIYLAVSIGCLLMAAIYSQIESHFLYSGYQNGHNCIKKGIYGSKTGFLNSDQGC